MARTSRALKRFGVAGLSAATVASGLIALAPAAGAAAYPITTATSVTLSPKSDTAAAGTCNEYTATVGPAGSTISVNIQQAIPANTTTPTAAGAVVIGFCNPLATNPDAGPTATQAGPGTAGSNSTANSATTCNNTAAVSTPASNVSCDTTYTDTNSDGKIVFGVMSNTAGSMSIDAFGDADGNGAHDIGEPGDTASKTWVANPATPANTDHVSCTPTSASNPAGSTHNFTCMVTDANGVALANQPVDFSVTSGPDAGVTTVNGNQNAQCAPTDNGAGGTTAGKAACSYDNNGTPGHDVIYVYLETNGTPGAQTGEPNTTITKDWVLASPSTSLVSVTCDAGTTGTTGATNNKSVTCTQPTSDQTTVFTATVVNGSPAQPVAGVIVQWSNPVQSGSADASTDTETLSATSCTTNAQGQCSVTLTDTLPTEGETQTVTATVPVQGGGTTQATGAVTYHNAQGGEARNIVVTPDTATQPSGGVQAFTAKVTDRFGNPVSNVCVGWTESGPGRFNNPDAIYCGNFYNADNFGTTCTTSAAGTCSVEVTTQASETGAESVTASLVPESATVSSYNYNNNGLHNECQAPAGKTYVAPSSSTTPGTSTGAVAGNCTDSSTVNWTAGAQPGGAPTITASQPNKTAGQNVTFSGTSSDTVTISISNATTGGFKTLTTITPTNGQWSYTTPISYNSTVKATNSAGSAQVTVNVNVKVTIDSIRFLGKDARGKCVTRFLGGTFPFIPGAPVWIRNSAQTPTQPIGYSTVFQFGGSGRYDVRFGLQCGQTYRLFSLISGTGANGTKYTDNGVGADRTYVAGT